MRQYRQTILGFLCVLCASVLNTGPLNAQSLPHVLIRTSLGEIEIEVDSVHAPKTAANFLRYVDLGFYGEFGRFHRTVRPDNQQREKIKIAVIQAGLEPYKARAFPPIPLENTKTTGLRHRDGTVSMARTAPNSATSDFFICIGDQPALDFGGKRNPDGQGFAAFGRVVRGTGAVKKIQEAPAKGETLTPEIPILGAARVPR